MLQTKISILLDKSKAGKDYLIKGWVRTARHPKGISFIEVNDGSCVMNLQIVADADLPEYKNIILRLTTGSSIAIVGRLIESPAKGQPVELQARRIDLIGYCPSEGYPLQKKRHSFEFLRSILHLRPRTNTQGVVMRIRSSLAYYTHRFFQKRGFLYINTPIITSSDCEGAGEMFQVTMLDLANPPRMKDNNIDFSKDFFGHKTFLTVSGQINIEPFCCALGDVYTFGPTFRAENSNTTRHCSEFWMVEPEIAFAGMKEVLQLAEDYLKYLFSNLLDERRKELEFCNKWLEKGLFIKLENVINNAFKYISYTEAVSILKKAKRKFEFPVFWGMNLQAEHECYITERVFKSPVAVIDYPKQIKAFYMRLNDDNKTVGALDVLVPGIGEIIGGSVREEREQVLKQRIEDTNLPLEEYRWYLELRRYGTIPHAGFGAGFERFVQYATGIKNIRDVISYPRTPGNALF